MGEHGRGTRTQLPNGRWRVAVTMSDGHRIWRRAKTEKQADAILRELVEARELDLDPSRQTLAGWLRLWISSLRDAKRQRLAPRTLDHYAMIVERHIIPGLDPKGQLALDGYGRLIVPDVLPRGSVPLTRVTERRIQAWLDASNGSARTIHHHRGVLRVALNRAVRQRLLSRNPAAGRAIELPMARWTGARPLTIDEARALLTSSEGSRWHPLWRLAIVTGLRFGELMGLTWDDVEPGAVVVRAQMQRLAGAWVRRSTKTARTMERIAIDPKTSAILDAHHLRLAGERTEGWRYFGHVFIDEHGNPYHHRTVYTAFLRACDAARIPRRRFHDMRASSATLMRGLGVAEDTRMSRMGHSTTAMARHYAGASETQDREAVEKLAEAIG
jgi:integrase